MQTPQSILDQLQGTHRTEGLTSQPGLTQKHWAKPAVGNGSKLTVADLDLHFSGLEDLVGLCRLFQVSWKRAHSLDMPP